MARKISKSDIVLTREQELAVRADAAAPGLRSPHFAPGTSVTIAGEGSFEVIAADAARTTLRLRGHDGSERTVLRPCA